MGSFSLPVDMVSRSFTRMAARFSLTSAGRSSGKKETTLSSTLSFLSATANPTAVEVKLLLMEYIVCTSSGPYGSHQPSAMTCPWRSIMKLCSSIFSRSMASRKSMIA